MCTLRFLLFVLMSLRELVLVPSIPTLLHPTCLASPRCFHADWRFHKCASKESLAWSSVHLGVTNTEVLLYVLGQDISFLHFIFALPAYCHGVSRVLVPFLAYGLVGSFVLCWFFIVSHNLDGLQTESVIKRFRVKTGGDGRSRLRPLGETASGHSSLVGFNYQIEHHLFPGTAHIPVPRYAVYY